MFLTQYQSDHRSQRRLAVGDVAQEAQDRRAEVPLSTKPSPDTGLAIPR